MTYRNHDINLPQVATSNSHRRRWAANFASLDQSKSDRNHNSLALHAPRSGAKLSPDAEYVYRKALEYPLGSRLTQPPLTLTRVLTPETWVLVQSVHTESSEHTLLSELSQRAQLVDKALRASAEVVSRETQTSNWKERFNESKSSLVDAMEAYSALLRLLPDLRDEGGTRYFARDERTHRLAAQLKTSATALLEDMRITHEIHRRCQAR